MPNYRLLGKIGATRFGTLPAQIEDTLGAAGVQLPDEALAKLGAVSRISLGFPHDFLGSDSVQDMVKRETWPRLLERPRRR